MTLAISLRTTRDFPTCVSDTPRSSVSSQAVSGCIAAFQFVAKAHFLRNYKTQCRVVNFEITRERRKTKIVVRRVVLSVGNNLFNMHRRRHCIPTQMTWIDHLQHDTICEPQPSIGSSCGSGEGSPARLHTVKCVKSLKLHGDVRLSPPSLQIRTCNFDEPALRV